MLLHAHPPYVTALSCLQDPTLVPIDQNTARFFGDAAYDTEFGGIADDEAEGRRLATVMGDRTVLMMGNHGVTVAGASVAEAYESFYYLERACRTLVLAYSTGHPLTVLSDDMAAKVAKGWGAFAGVGPTHLAAGMADLDATEPDYRS